MGLRVRQKTLSRISNLLKQNSVLKTDLGNLIFRIDSASSIPHKQKSQRSEQETPGQFAGLNDTRSSAQKSTSTLSANFYRKIQDAKKQRVQVICV